MLKKMAVLLIAPFLLVGCTEVTYEYTKVKGVVSYKYYDAPWLQPISTGKVTTFIHHPASYNVGILYEGVETNFNDEDLYDSLEIGDSLEVNLVRRIDAETGRQLKSYLELIK